jgi:hypothetical protein
MIQNITTANILVKTKLTSENKSYRGLSPSYLKQNKTKTTSLLQVHT